MPLEQLKFCDLCGSDHLAIHDESADISRCSSCGYMFDNPRPCTGDIIAYYSSAGKFDPWLDEEEGRDILWRRRLSKVTDYVSGGRLLDVGAGIGQFLHHAKNHFVVDGTEVSAEAVRLAEDRYGVKVSQCRLEESAEFEAESFDCVTMTHVLEHVPSPSETLRKCHALLKDGGYLFVAVPNDEFAFWRHGGVLKYVVKRILAAGGVRRFKKLVRFEKIVLDPAVQTEIHLSHFTGSTLEKFVKRCGFEIVENTLDPYYSATGFNLFLKHLRFTFYLAVKKLLRHNFYETILIIGRK